MKPLRIPQDAQKVAVDAVTALLAGAGRTEAVSATLPADWTPASPMHVQVAFDGTPTVEWPIRTVAAIRVTVWGRIPTDVRTLARLCHGLVLTFDGVRPGAGLLPATDPNGAYLASFTVNWSLFDA